MREFNPQKENLITYHGPISINLLSFIGNYLKMILNTDYKIFSKIYKVFIELTQNVSYYSAESKEVDHGLYSGIGWFSLNEYEDCFKFTTANLILKEHATILDKNCNEINSLNETELRELKRKTRGQAKIRDIGAHIGLIHTGLISGNNLEFQIDNIDEKYSYFTISAKMDK